MQRLLQGDVGSGKTVVALYALLRAVEAGRQGALMAPTETLAEQHFLTIEGLCAELGVACVLRRPARDEHVDADAVARADVAVGTHALIQEGSSSATSPSRSSTSSTASASSSARRSPRAARRTSCT